MRFATAGGGVGAGCGRGGAAEVGAGIGSRRAGSRREEEEAPLLLVGNRTRGAGGAEGRATRGLNVIPLQRVEANDPGPLDWRQECLEA